MKTSTIKIAVLHSSYEGSNVPFKGFDPDCDPSRYLPGPSYMHFSIRKMTAAQQVIKIAWMGFDVVINLCDGAWDEDRAGIEVVRALESLGVAFTGAGSAFYDPSREAMKIACYSAGVRFPAYILARSVDDTGCALDRLRFPMIVKHPRSYSSIGLTRHSRVIDAEGLRREISRMVESYGAALIEEFIEGQEFTVLVSEPRNEEEDAWALEPLEVLFPEGDSFKHFNLKWTDFPEGERETCIVNDEALASRLREASALTFFALRGSGYGRCDFRVDAAGEVYFLEINPNCGIFYPEGSFGSADLILANDTAGHRGFLEHLLFCATRRQERMRKSWELRFDREHGFGMFAMRELKQGEVVERYEERAQVLVSRNHVQRHWRGLQREWFERYAWPVTENLFALWSDNPEDWRPINHSCDPNTWLEGLDLVARGNISAGEQLTVDYATFCGLDMMPFECDCGSVVCRRIIRGSDYLLPEIRERYGDHVSDYIRAAWRNNEGATGLPFGIAKNEAGLGLVARRAWQAGEIISPLSWGKRQPEPTRRTIQCAADEHAEPLPFELRYVNHSCNPNVFFDLEENELRALRDIMPSDEFKYFYPSTEWDMAEPFDCNCGAVDCVGSIGGAAHLPLEILQRYILSRIIREKLKAQLPSPPKVNMLHPAVSVKHSQIEGSGLFATAPIKEGEIVWRDEGQDLPRVHIDVIRSWSSEKRQRFRRHSYQIDEEWHVGNEDGSVTDPSDYLNHSCDPNTWWSDHQTLTARRDIKVGEELSYDYATTETHEFFHLVCNCGSPLCRKVIRGTDYRLDKSLQKRYGRHVMPHVLRTAH